LVKAAGCPRPAMGMMSRRGGGSRWCPRCTTWWLQRSVVTEEGAALAWRESRQGARGASTYRGCPEDARASLSPGLPGAEGN